MKNIFKLKNIYLKSGSNVQKELKGTSFFSENYPFIKIPKILFSNRNLIMTKEINYLSYKKILETGQDEISKLENLFLNYISESRKFEQKNSICPFIMKKDSKRRFGNLLDMFVENLYPQLNKIKVSGYALQGDASIENIGIDNSGKLAIIDFEHFSRNGQIPFELLGFYSPIFIKKIKERKEIDLDEILLKKIYNLITDDEFRLFQTYLLRDIGIFSFYQDKNFKEDFSNKLGGLIKNLI